MMQELEQVEKKKKDTGVRQKGTAFSFVDVESDTSGDSVKVELVNTRVVQETQVEVVNGKEQKKIDLSEEEERREVSYPKISNRYQRLAQKAGPAYELGMPTETVDNSTMTSLLAGWMAMLGETAEAAIEQEQFIFPGAEKTSVTAATGRPEDGATQQTTRIEAEDIEAAEFRELELRYEEEYESGEYENAKDMLEDLAMAEIAFLEPETGAEKDTYSVADEFSLPAALELLGAENGLEEVELRGGVVHGMYAQEENEKGVQNRYLLQPHRELLQEGEVRADELLEHYIETGYLDAAVADQPFYFVDQDGSGQWTSSPWIIDFEDADIMGLEFLVADRSGSELSQSALTDTYVSGNEMFEIRESDEFLHSDGEIAPSGEIIDAWEDEYRWWDDRLKRSVYAVLAEGNEVTGTVDLYDMGMDDVRDAYIEDFGTAPELEFDSVEYSGIDTEPGPVQALSST